MHANQLVPAGNLAQRFGVKAVCFGGPGTGKTPIANTAPRPVLVAAEPGLLSMRGSTIPTWEAYTIEKIYEFFTWLYQSAEAKQFDTVCIDSISEIAETILTAELKRNRDGRKAYGEMSRAVMDNIVRPLYYMPQKHVYMIAKQGTEDRNGVPYKRPYFPGQDLNVKVPHLYDEILHIAPAVVPGQVGQVIAFRTKETFDAMARDRSGRLAELEPPHLGNLFAKAMQ